VITEQQAKVLFTDANPIPNTNVFDPIDVDAAKYLATLEQRSSEMTQVETDKKIQREKTPVRSLWLVTAALIILAGVALAWLNSGQTTTVAGQPNDHAATIEAYTAAYNAGDIDEVMAFFSEEFVMTDHPFNESVTGLVEMRGVMLRDIASATPENAYTISNVEVSGNTVTWDGLWVNKQGQEYCQFGQSAVVEDGTILLWTWPAGDLDCP